MLESSDDLSLANQSSCDLAILHARFDLLERHFARRVVVTSQSNFPQSTCAHLADQRVAFVRRCGVSVLENAEVTIRAGLECRHVEHTEETIDRFENLRTLKLGVRANDLRIAAIALISGATVVTRNVADFGSVPDLSVENWAN